MFGLALDLLEGMGANGIFFLVVLAISAEVFRLELLDAVVLLFDKTQFAVFSGSALRGLVGEVGKELVLGVYADFPAFHGLPTIILYRKITESIMFLEITFIDQTNTKNS